MPMAKVGIYGGSFNPVHFGHMGLAEWVLTHTDLDELWLMVTPNNPLKDSRILADEHERLNGVREAISRLQLPAGKRLVASDFEFHLPRPSYTANTLRELRKAYPEHTFTLIIGEDNLAIFTRWREYQTILDNHRVFVYPRHGTTDIPEMQPKPVFLVGAPYFDISSTQIRQQKEGAEHKNAK